MVDRMGAFVGRAFDDSRTFYESQRWSDGHVCHPVSNRISIY